MKNRPKYLNIAKDDITIEFHRYMLEDGSKKVDLIFSKLIECEDLQRAKYVLEKVVGTALKDEIMNDITDEQ